MSSEDRGQSDRQLLIQAQHGDRQAFDELIRPRWERIWRIAWRIVGDRTEAEDLAQRCCLRLWETLQRVRPDEELDGWIYRMTVNLALDSLRRRRARPETAVETVPERPQPESDPSRALLATQLEAAFAAATATLPPRQKAAFVLVTVEGLTPQQAAAALGVAPSTARNLLFQARAELSRYLMQHYPELLGQGRNRS